MASSPLRTSLSGPLCPALLKAARMRVRSFTLSSTMRIVWPSFTTSSIRLLQFEPKTAALAGNRFHAHPSAHAFDALLDYGQADACARELIAFESGEQAKNLALMAG